MIMWSWLLLGSFFCCFLEVEPVEGNPLRKPRKVVHTKGRYRQPKSVGTFKAIDLSEDSDQEEDENGEYTSAFIEKENLPDSFTICSAFSVDSWSTEFSQSALFALLSEEGQYWAFFELYASDKHTEYIHSKSEQIGGDLLLSTEKLAEKSAYIRTTKFCDKRAFIMKI